MLSQTDARARQFRGLRGAVAASASATIIGHVAFAAAVAVASAAITRACNTPTPGLFGYVRTVPHPNVLPALAAILSLVIALPPLFALLRTGRRLREIARAVPPLRAGEPSACRVCGGAVTGLGVVRCRFCSADNVVDASVLARAGEAHSDAAHDLEGEVQAQAAALGETRGLGFPMVAALALFPVPFIATWLGEPLAARIDIPVTKDAGFALDEEGPLPGHQTKKHALCVRNASACLGAHSGCVALDRVAAQWLTGRTTVEGRRISAVHDNALRGLEVVVEGGEVQPLSGTCVEGPESEAWRSLAAAELAAQEERDRRDKAAAERLKRLFPDGGPPVPELQLVPIPSGLLGR